MAKSKKKKKTTATAKKTTAAMKAATAAAAARPARVVVPGTLSATAKDRLGNVLKDASFTWGSSNAKVLYFEDPSKGEFKARVKQGRSRPVTVTATAPNGKQDTMTVIVGTIQ